MRGEAIIKHFGFAIFRKWLTKGFGFSIRKVGSNEASNFSSCPVFADLLLLRRLGPANQNDCRLQFNGFRAFSPGWLKRRGSLPKMAWMCSSSMSEEEPRRS